MLFSLVGRLQAFEVSEETTLRFAWCWQRTESSVFSKAEHIKALDAICIITQQGATAATIPG